MDYFASFLSMKNIIFDSFQSMKKGLSRAWRFFCLFPEFLFFQAQENGKIAYCVKVKRAMCTADLKLLSQQETAFPWLWDSGRRPWKFVVIVGSCWCWKSELSIVESFKKYYSEGASTALNTDNDYKEKDTAIVVLSFFDHFSIPQGIFEADLDVIHQSNRWTFGPLYWLKQCFNHCVKRGFFDNTLWYLYHISWKKFHFRATFNLMWTWSKHFLPFFVLKVEIP